MTAALRALLLVVLLAGLMASAAAAQEETTGPAGDDPLTRYDSPQTSALAARQEQDRERAAEIEARIEELEAEGDFGVERDRLMDELAEMPDETEAANAISNARLEEITSSKLPEGLRAKADEKRRKAESLEALQSDSQDTSIDSEVYWGQAETLADRYRRDAQELDSAAAVREAADEEKAAAEEAVPEPGPDGGGEEAGGAGSAEDAPPVPAETDYVGGGGDPNPGTLLMLVVMALGATAYGLSLVARRTAGRKLSGAWRARFGAMMASVGSPAEKPQEPPREEPRQGFAGEAPEATAGRPGAATAPAQGPGKPEGGTESPGAATGRVTPEERPSTATETGSPDAAALAEWFSKEAPSERPQPEQKKEFRREGRRRRRRGEAPEDIPDEAPEPSRKAPAPVDVNRLVAEEVARMRRSGELGPDDEVAVTVGSDGRIRVRKKG